MNIFKNDKVLHFLVNVVATLISFGVAYINPRLLIPFLAIGLSIGKEYGDSKAKGNKWDWWDILADGLGIVFVLITLLVI